MAPITQKTITQVEVRGKYSTPLQPKTVDFSKLCIGDYMLSDRKSEKEDFLRQRLDKVQEHNEPIKEEIELCKQEIKQGHRELSALKRLFKKSDDCTEKATLKEQISDANADLWRLIRSNCHRAWSLMRV